MYYAANATKPLMYAGIYKDRQSLCEVDAVHRIAGSGLCEPKLIFTVSIDMRKTETH